MAASKSAVLSSLAPDEKRRAALEVLENFIPHREDDTGDALVATDIGISFGGLQAVKAVNMTVPARHMVGLIGPNGAGKSTTFDLINGMKRPDTGTVNFFGKDVTNTKPWDRAMLGMSRTFQSNKISPDLSVADNLLSGAHKMIEGNMASAILGIGKARRSERAARAAAYAMAQLLDIDRHWNEYAGNLDFGSQRRIEIGRSIISGPRLLLLDEPSAGLDARESSALFTLVRRLHLDLGLTVLLVEHYVRAVMETCDYIYVLNQGALMAEGTPREIAHNEEVRTQYLGSLFDASDISFGGENH